MRKVAFRVVLALGAVALALPMMAKAAKPDVKTKNATLTLDAPVKFGSTMVKPGTYRLVIDNEKATIENGVSRRPTDRCRTFSCTAIPAFLC
jgi:hypothetical protein